MRIKIGKMWVWILFVLTLVACVHTTRKAQGTRSVAALDAERPVHLFEPRLVKKIVTPDRAKKESLLQYPVVPSQSIQRIHFNLDKDLKPGPNRGEQLALKMELIYGLNEYTTSHYPDVARTYAETQGVRTGVSPNCFMCHSSRIEDKVYFGIGNTRVDIRKFFHDVVPKGILDNVIEGIPVIQNILPIYKDLPFFGLTKPVDKLIRTQMLNDYYLFVRNPETQSVSSGHTNPWSFASQLFKWRDNDLNYVRQFNGRDLRLPSVVMDPMPWWHMRYKKYINWDSIMKKSPRGIIISSLAPGKSGEELRSLDGYYTELFDEIEKLDPPVFPKLADLDSELIHAGETIFNQRCVGCHGIYSENGVYNRDPAKFKYPETILDARVIGTDPLRADTIDRAYLDQLEASWIGYYGDPKYAFRKDKMGYVAPPLWGIWASAPYFHNGSVPTLRELLFPEERPQRWKIRELDTRRTPFDYIRVGLDVIRDLPQDADDSKLYDTTLGDDGRSNTGHLGPLSGLSGDDKLKILEYLKTL